MRRDINDFVGDAPQFDDITMLGFHYAGQKEKNMREMTIEATRENLPQAMAFVDETLEKMNCGIKVKTQIDVAVEELFVNIASYAYQPDVGPATLRVKTDENDPQTVVITFIDQGVPYNPLEKSDPDTTLPAEQRQIGGLGIYMVKKSMDAITYEYRNGHNILTIKKRVS